MFGNKPKPLALLKKHFNYSAFRSEQEQIIQSVLDGHDTLVVMPTGGGKSVCYQIPALCLDGITIVVSPLIALMKDQVDQLTGRDISAIALNSSIPQDELRRVYDELDQYKLIYVSPERLSNNRFLDRIKTLPIQLIAIDEAHCISQWGHDFRPSYRKINQLSEIFPTIPKMALTATATPEVRKDISETLKLRKPAIFVKGFDRVNLKWVVLYDKDKLAKIRDVLAKVKGSILIYASTRKAVEEIHQFLAEVTDELVDYYHAGLSEADRIRVQDEFIANQIRVLICTNAFGMGIDKPDVRCVIHYNLPSDIESYYQESGRAGRDGKFSFAVLCYSYADVRIQEYFINNQLPNAYHAELIYDVLKKAAEGAKMQDLIALYPDKISETEIVLRFMHRFGLIQSDDRGVMTLTGEKGLKKHLRSTERQVENATAKLKSVIHYCEKRSCRRNQILDYFGEKNDGGKCGRCDICLGRNKEATSLSQKEILAALRLVKENDERFGIGTFADCLVGNYSEMVEKHKLYNYGDFAAWKKKSKKAVFFHLNELINMGYLIKTLGKYPLLKLSSTGKKITK